MLPTNQPVYQPSSDLQLSDHLFKTAIDGLYYIRFDKHPDDRGSFSEVFIVPEIESVTGQPFTIKQFNFSLSKTNVVRGMHAEGWNKLVTVLDGTAFCALADVRPTSPTFMAKEYFVFDFEQDQNHGSALFIPAGLGNSICAVSGPVRYLYGVDKLYQDRDRNGDKAISIFDPDLHISWPVAREEMIVSDRDINSITVRELYPEKFA